MARFYSLILSFLILLPHCGMVFANEIGMMEHHSAGASMMMEEHPMDESIQEEGYTENTSPYQCCDPNTKDLIDKNILLSPSLKQVISRVPETLPISLRENIQKETHILTYRPHAPPDPSEYISLIGSSVKNLN